MTAAPGDVGYRAKAGERAKPPAIATILARARPGRRRAEDALRNKIGYTKCSHTIDPPQALFFKGLRRHHTAPFVRMARVQLIDQQCLRRLRPFACNALQPGMSWWCGPS